MPYRKERLRKGIPYRHPRSEVIVRLPFLPLPGSVSEREYRIVILDRRLSSGRPFQAERGRSSPQSFLSYRSFRSFSNFPRLLKIFEVVEVFGFAELPEFSKFFGFAELPKFSKISEVGELFELVEVFGFAVLPEFSKLFGVVEVFFGFA
ncbi:hypothetical protein MTP99_005758 [Tenebrio molitor]|nr:hypothetical protein MTP99_005758 [Tenebrio molitor]